jgi:hypothetical protein
MLALVRGIRITEAENCSVMPADFFMQLKRLYARSYLFGVSYQLSIKLYPPAIRHNRHNSANDPPSIRHLSAIYPPAIRHTLVCYATI